MFPVAATDFPYQIKKSNLDRQVKYVVIPGRDIHFSQLLITIWETSEGQGESRRASHREPLYNTSLGEAKRDTMASLCGGRVCVVICLFLVPVEGKTSEIERGGKGAGRY